MLPTRFQSLVPAQIGIKEEKFEFEKLETKLYFNSNGVALYMMVEINMYSYILEKIFLRSE